MNRKLSRREVTGAFSALAMAAIVPSHVLGVPGRRPSSDRLLIGAVGIGGMSHGLTRGAGKEEENVVALCDVDHAHAKKTFDLYPQARRYFDFREMFDKETDLDGVIVGTPDHTHTTVSLAAIRRGIHVLCVKPLTRTIHEATVVAEAARKAGVMTHCTAQARFRDKDRGLSEMLGDGPIGEVREVHCWVPNPSWSQGMARPAGSDPVPEHLKWDLWIGQAPGRPFKDEWPADALPPRQIPWHTYNPFQNKAYHPFTHRG